MQWSPALPMETTLEGGEGGEFDAGVRRGRGVLVEYKALGGEVLKLVLNFKSCLLGAFDLKRRPLKFLVNF